MIPIGPEEAQSRPEGPGIIRPSGVVLCGGPSSRMGTNKALLTWQGEPLWRRAAKTITPFVEEVFLGVGTDRSFDDAGFPIVRDRGPGLGPLAGLEAALAGTAGPWVLLLGCDLPGVGSTTLEGLVGGATGTAQMVQYGSYAEPEPLCALYHQSLLPAVREAIGAGKRKMTSFLDTTLGTGIDARWLAPCGQVTQELCNVNHPAEWEAWQAAQTERGTSE